MGLKAYKSVKDVPGDIDVAVFAIPAKFVAGGNRRVRREEDSGRRPHSFRVRRNRQSSRGRRSSSTSARKHGVRLMGPNIYGFYYTWSNLCATFCTAYDVKGHAALSSQSGGIGMAIIGFSRSAKMGVSAIVGLGNKSDIDEDDLLTFFEQDDNTHIIVQHCEDLKDGRAFAEVARRVSKKKPVVVLKAGRTALGAKRGQLAHGRARGQRQDLRRCAQAVGRDSRAFAARDARVRARASHPADAQGRQHRDHHRRRRLRRAAVRCGRGQRPVADGDSAGPRCGVQASSFRRSVRRATRSTSPAASRRRPTRTPSVSGSRIRGSTR